MNRFSSRMEWLAGGALAAAIAIGGVGLAMAGGTDDDRPLTGTELERATEAALEHTGGGTVLETEVGDEADDDGQSDD